jgi:hypothetical protein
MAQSALPFIEDKYYYEATFVFERASVEEERPQVSIDEAIEKMLKGEDI